MVPPVEWHPRQLARASEWTLTVAGQPSPIGVIRVVTHEGRRVFRLVTWAARSADRELIDYYPDGDAAAVACWERYLAGRRAAHEVASRTHGSDQRHPERNVK